MIQGRKVFEGADLMIRFFGPSAAAEAYLAALQRERAGDEEERCLWLLVADAIDQVRSRYPKGTVH